MNIKRADWVRCKSGGPVGIVRRLASDGSWADVDWRTHVKRMRTEVLVVEHTIPLGDGVTVTDVTREKEMGG